MYYELALISVLVAGGYWGWYFVRHDATRVYGALQLVAAALAGLGLYGRHLEDSSLGIPGAVGAGAGACLLILGPLARGAARRLAANERFTVAKLMLDIAEVLAPGSGVPDEKALLAAMREIRDGNIEQAVQALTAAKDRAPADARLAIDERIAMLYLASYRWDEAISHAEENLFGAIPQTGEGAPGPVAIRRALGIAPHVWVELLGAYGYQGDLDQAARMLARLEDVCAGRPDATIWLHRGRLIFLALSGRVDAVQKLVEPRRSRHMKSAARAYWLAVAHERHGDVALAESTYGKARARSHGRPRVLIDQALERLKSPKPVELGAAANEIIARVEAEPPPAVIERARPRGPVATRILMATLVAPAVAIALLLGSSTDDGVLIRAGALIHQLVAKGEWWRLISCIFVHGGGFHLFVNFVGLWLLGRLSEELFGPWRTLAVFAIAGLGGSTASYLATHAISVGASGAIFGLLGAVFIELTWHRKRHRLAWTRGVWGSLVVVALAQVGTDFFYPITDHWAHAGGLFAGVVVGTALSPNAGWHKLGLHAARVIAIAFAATVVVATVCVVRTSLYDSLVRSPELAVEIAPFERIPLIGNIDAYIGETVGRANQKGIENVHAAKTQVVPLPAGWDGHELVGSVPNQLGDPQVFRVIVARSDHSVVTLYVPEGVATMAPEYFTQLIRQL
jgi:membrane associated rhomboid family serine protease/tetratricopeptide (TPR) repeat protein